MPLNKSYLNKLRKSTLDYATIRRDVIKISGDALHNAKRAIFALHRDDKKEAEKKLKESKALLNSIQKKFAKNPRAMQEGSYKAAVEEYVEAVLFHQFVTTGKVGEIKGMKIDAEIYIAGLCDVPGELYRYAIKAATNRDLKTVKKCAEMGAEISGALIEFNLTSYLRNKFDQAKQAVRKLEQVVYEVSLREK